MTRATDIRARVIELDADGNDPDEIAFHLNIPIARVERILDEQDAAQGVPHPERTRAPVLEPLGGPAVITSQAAVGGGRDKNRSVPKRQPVGTKPRPPAKPRTWTPVECGTTRGYEKHRREKTTTCDPCQRARAEYDAERRPAKEKDPILCGTFRGRGKHKRAGEPVCEECRVAYNAWQRAEYDKNGGRIKVPYRVIEHGTPAGHRAHLRRGQESCDPCREAFNESRWKPITHGTRAGYVQHNRRKEEPCPECRAANAAASKAGRKRKAS